MLFPVLKPLNSFSCNLVRISIARVLFLHKKVYNQLVQIVSLSTKTIFNYTLFGNIPAIN
jgi:hypothetical protein